MTNTSFFRKEWLYIVHANSSKVWTTSKTGQEKKKKFCVNNLFSKCKTICRKLQISLHEKWIIKIPKRILLRISQETETLNGKLQFLCLFMITKYLKKFLREIFILCSVWIYWYNLHIYTVICYISNIPSLRFWWKVLGILGAVFYV